MLTLIVLLVFAGAVVFDLLPFKQRPKKHNVTYCVLLSIGFVVLMLFSFGVEVPSPTEPINSIVEALTK